MRITVTNEATEPEVWFVEPVPADAISVAPAATLTVEVDAAPAIVHVEITTHPDGHSLWVNREDRVSVPVLVSVGEEIFWERPDGFPEFPTPSARS